MTNICRRVLITLGMICVMLNGLWLLAGCGLDGKTDDNAGKDQAVSKNQTTEKTVDQTTEETDNQQDETSEYTSQSDPRPEHAEENVDTSKSSNAADQSEEDNKTMIYVALGDSLTKGDGHAQADKNRFSAEPAKKRQETRIKSTDRK